MLRPIANYCHYKTTCFVTRMYFPIVTCCCIASYHATLSCFLGNQILLVGNFVFEEVLRTPTDDRLVSLEQDLNALNYILQLLLMRK